MRLGADPVHFGMPITHVAWLVTVLPRLIGR